MTMPKSILSLLSHRVLTALGIALTACTLPAATVVWSGTSGTGTNWSTGANWTPANSPAGADDVKFFDPGAVAVPLTPNNLVDTSFGIGTLQFGQTNLGHTISIAAGQTLFVTNGNFIVGTAGDLGVTKDLTNAISGAGGTLMVSNPAAVISIQQGTATGVNGSRGNLNLSGLDTFIANVRAIGLGSTAFPNPGAANQREAGSLILAKTNYLTLTLTDTLANYGTAGRTNAIELSRNPGNPSASFSLLILGQSNVINVDSMGFGRDKASASSAGTLAFNPVFTNNNPVAVFRGPAGGFSRVTWWALGDMNANASSAQVAVGTNDFSNGTVDARIETLVLGRDCSPSHTATAVNYGTFIFNSGLVDANTVIIGNQAIGVSSSTSPVRGTLLVGGANATLVVNSNLLLGNTTQASVAAVNTSGTLNIYGGTVRANRISVGANSATNIINLNNGTLLVSNAIATAASPLPFLNATNSILRLNVAGVTNVFVSRLTLGGTSNLISPDSVAVFATYPKQVVLIKYGTLAGPAYNLALTNIPASAPGAYLSNNVANSSIDLVLPSDPRPVILAQPASYSGSPGDEVNFSVTISAESVLPLTYQWYHGATRVVDGPTGNGSTNAGSSTATFAIQSAQPGDNGNYTVIITNVYGAATSAPPAVLTISAGDVAPSLTGPNNQTVIQGNNAIFSVTASGNPAPALQWRRNGVDLVGENGTSYTVINAQYPADDGAVFSIVATNVAGSVTNSATLTVMVTPTISAQPVNLVVTNTQAASFSVTAGGVPAPTYQWFFNNNPINNETNSTLNFASAAPTNIGTYKVVVNNAAGSMTSSNATLIVNSTMSAAALAPANGATGVCYDTPLAITFTTPPQLRSAGTIKIFNVTNSLTPVDTINLSGTAVQQRAFPGDGQTFSHSIVTISGATATIFPHFNLITSNQTYFVTVDNGVFTDAAGAYFAGITDSNIWRFATKVGGPADANNPIVNADGTGDFLTVQGAVNSFPTGNTTPRVINIRNGIYNEIVNISGKHNVTFRGQSLAGTVVGYANNATFQTANAGTTHARMAFKLNANDIVLDSLTVSNMTPQGGSQAEALMIESGAKRCIVYNSEIDSRQDTILANVNSSQAYFYKSLIKGNFDYVWGGGNLFFDQCEIRTIGGTGNANFSAARTDTAGSTSTNFPWANPGGGFTANGVSFVKCNFTAEPGVGPVTLAGGNGTAGNNVSWSACDFATNYVAPSAALFSGNYLFWQNANTVTSSPVTFGVLTAISGNDARLLAATNIPTWFYGWSPSLAPIIQTNPVSLTVNYGSPATFTVVASGIPSPTYQWQHAGTNLPSATSASLTIGSATSVDAGAYAVIVTTPAGSVTSATATLTVNPPPNSAPGFTAPLSGTNIAINVGVNLALANNASDSDTPAQMLTYALLNGPSGAAINPTNGLLTWRPTVAQQNSANPVQVVVTDDGTPNLSATNYYTVSVHPLTPPDVDTTAFGGGQFTFSVNGQVGPDYTVQVSTNLLGAWSDLFTTNPIAMPFSFTDPNGDLPEQFYRILVGP